MNSETNTCAFCRNVTEVNRQYLHAKNKPLVGDGFAFILYCNDCGLLEFMAVPMSNDCKKDPAVALPCSCPKGGMFSDGSLCKDCNGSEYIDMPKRSDGLTQEDLEKQKKYNEELKREKEYAEYEEQRHFDAKYNIGA